jgi:glycosyltransferase involved in cell wall biosynthesis
MVSIIITAYNYDRYIERAIRSCLDQSIPKKQYEIIVVNDCSTDNTKMILDNYKEDIRIFNLERTAAYLPPGILALKRPWVSSLCSWMLTIIYSVICC